MASDSTLLGVLNDLTRQILDASSTEDALTAVTDAALQLLPCEHASIRTLDDSRTLLMCAARSGDGGDERPLSFREGEGIIGWVARHGEPARVHDTMNDPRFKDGDEQGFTVRSLLAAPLVSKGNTLGVLGATSSRARVFSADDETTAVLLANCAVHPIERVRLERLVLMDPETMAGGPTALLPRLDEETSRARRHELPLSLLRVRVDDLPAEGPPVRFFADTVRLALRTTDVMVRAGDRELAVILPHTDEKQASIVVERLKTTLEGSSVGEKLPLWPAAIGIATWDGAETSAELNDRSAPPENLEG